MANVEIYTNKKFDILKIITMVLKRKEWGKTYTLYSTPTHEILIVMSSYYFEDRYAKFKIIINEKVGNGYYSNDLNIYTDREDYTVKFVNKLLLRTIISYLKNYRKNIFENEAYKLFPYVYRSSESDDYWINEFGLSEKVEKIKTSQLSDEDKLDLIDTLIDKKFSDYDTKVTYQPRRDYVANAMESDREPQILQLIEEIEKELKEVDNG
ncbi:hypothetical protein IJE86_01450 [bacterium]|nr:hypothetical protein [bacterium]